MDYLRIRQPGLTRRMNDLFILKMDGDEIKTVQPNYKGRAFRLSGYTVLQKDRSKRDQEYYTAYSLWNLGKGPKPERL